MTYPIAPPVQPMLAQLADRIPEGPGWLYEPKWDGFRAIVFRDGTRLHIASRNQLPLERYFPELVAALADALPERCVADGEIVIEGENGLDFDALQLRLHPAASRIKKLAQEMPSGFVPFDFLAEDDEDLRPLRFDERRRRLAGALRARPDVFLTPQTDDPAEAEDWFDRFEGAGLDGVIAKRADLPYVEKKRVMVKVKHERTADCVVIGYRLGKECRTLGSLLLGLYDASGTLHGAGFTSSFSARERGEVLAKLEPHETGAVHDEGPMGASRWNRGKDTSWVELRPELVCEVAFDHLQGDRFRHGTTFKRWRPDKDPRDCTYAQFTPPSPFSLDDIRRLGAGR